MSQSLIKIVDDKLRLVGSLPTTNPRVISIMGKARMGKSTFLNAIVTHLTKTNQAPFVAQDSDEHCTRGIDYYFLESHNLLLLDSQGLDYEDASHDPLLLLFLYLVSDLIIFNDNRRLENGALKLMEPICAFTNYLDVDTVIKPKLYFRIFDSDVKDSRKNLEKVLGTYNDQYQSIRNSIKHLFDPELVLLTTEPLDKPAKMMLETKLYKVLLEEEKYGFTSAIQQILGGVDAMNSKTILNKIPELVNQINSNQEIKIEKLDVVKLQAENDIHKWIQENIPPEMYSPIQVLGTQKSYDDNVKPRKDKKKQILTAFTKRFKDVDNSIRDPFYKDIDEKMSKPIDKATNDSIELATSIILKPLSEAKTHKFQEINSLNNSFTTIPDQTFFQHYLSVYNALENSLGTVYESVRLKYQDWINSIRGVIQSSLQSARDAEKEEQKKFCEYAASELVDFDVWCTEQITGKIDNSMLIKKNSSILQDLVSKKMKEFEQKASEIFQRRSLRFSFDNSNTKLISSFSSVDSKQGVACSVLHYDIAKNVLQESKNKLDTMVQSSEFGAAKLLVQEKADYLYGKLLGKNPWTFTVLSANPELDFIEDCIAAKYIINNPEHCIMTFNTHVDIFTPLYEKVASRLISKGYASSKENITPAFTEIKHSPNSQLQVISLIEGKDRYAQSLCILFEMQLHKVFCQEVVNGFKVPSVLQENAPVFKTVTLN